MQLEVGFIDAATGFDLVDSGVNAVVIEVDTALADPTGAFTAT